MSLKLSFWKLSDRNKYSTFFVQCALLSTERSFALALSFCTTTNSVVLSQLRSAQDSNTCVLRFNEKYSVNFRIFSNFPFWQCFLESVLKRVTVLKLQTTDNLCEVLKVYIFIMDQGKKILIWSFDFVLKF